MRDDVTASSGFLTFEFDLPGALLNQLVVVLDGMSSSDLTEQVTCDLPDAQGVYQLFLNNELVYIGKTDSEAGLRTRLSRHAVKIRHRPSLTGKVTFKAVQILVFTAMDLETQLIKHYTRLDAKPTWNGSGFGSNDPGRERETTNRSPEGFDYSYGISIDEPISDPLLQPGARVGVSSALTKLKELLPYTLRYETQRNGNGKAMRGKPHPDLVDATVVVPAGPVTTRSVMGAIAESLGPEWRATVFHSHVILYKENREYKFGHRIGPGGVLVPPADRGIETDEA